MLELSVDEVLLMWVCHGFSVMLSDKSVIFQAVTIEQLCDLPTQNCSSSGSTSIH